MEEPLAWLGGEIMTPPFSSEARMEAGFLLRRLQRGEQLAMPHSRPMPSIAPRCHEPRIRERDQIWRIIYSADPDAIVILEIFSKKTSSTPKRVIDDCRRRLRNYDKGAKP
jgi:phage-related protein